MSSREHEPVTMTTCVHCNAPLRDAVCYYFYGARAGAGIWYEPPVCDQCYAVTMKVIHEQVPAGAIPAENLPPVMMFLERNGIAIACADAEWQGDDIATHLRPRICRHTITRIVRRGRCAKFAGRLHWSMAYKAVPT